MTILIRSRTARIDTALFVTAAVLWAVCPYVVHRISSSDHVKTGMARMIAPNHGSLGAGLPIHATSDQTAAAGHGVEHHGLYVDYRGL